MDYGILECIYSFFYCFFLKAFQKSKLLQTLEIEQVEPAVPDAPDIKETSGKITVKTKNNEVNSEDTQAHLYMSSGQVDSVCVITHMAKV